MDINKLVIGDIIVKGDDVTYVSNFFMSGPQVCKIRVGDDGFIYSRQSDIVAATNEMLNGAQVWRHVGGRKVDRELIAAIYSMIKANINSGDSYDSLMIENGFERIDENQSLMDKLLQLVGYKAR